MQVAEREISVVQTERVQKIVMSILHVIPMEYVSSVKTVRVQIVMVNKTVVPMEWSVTTQQKHVKNMNVETDK